MNQLVGWNSYLAVTTSATISNSIFEKLQLEKRLRVDLFEFVLNKVKLAILESKACMRKANKVYQTFTSSWDRTAAFTIAI